MISLHGSSSLSFKITKSWSSSGDNGAPLAVVCAETSTGDFAYLLKRSSSLWDFLQVCGEMILLYLL